MSEWQPIYTAPKDGTIVDLWLTNDRGDAWRIVDAYYVTNRSWSYLAPDGEGGHSFVNSVRDGWMAAKMGDGYSDDWCDFPRVFDDHPDLNRWLFALATHWMPLPAPPVDAG